jgi:hypothetical protein
MLDNFTEAQVFGTGLAIGLSFGGIVWVISLAVWNGLNSSLKSVVEALMIARKQMLEDGVNSLEALTQMREENMRLQRIIEKGLYSFSLT